MSIEAAPLPSLLSNLPSLEEYANGDESISPVPNPQVHWIRGGGATAVGGFMANLVPTYMLANNASFVTFASLGTSRGYCRLMSFYSECKNPWAGTGSDIQRPIRLDFTITTRGPTEANYEGFPDLQLYPFGAAPVALIHSVANLTAPLILTRQLLAQIFRKCNLAEPTHCFPNDVRMWNDSRIVALNPGQEAVLSAAGEVQVVVRQDSAGITAAVKRAMAIFDANFSMQINNKQIDPDSNTWRSVDARFVHGLRSLAASVLTESSMISYVPLNVAEELQLNLIGIADDDENSTVAMKRAEAVFPSEATTIGTMLERGLDYGSDGVPPTRRTIEFNGGTNYRSWPVVMGAYIVLKLNHSSSIMYNNDTVIIESQTSSLCHGRKELFKFVKYLLDSDNPQVESIAGRSGLVRMPREALIDSTAHLEANFRCEDGRLVSERFKTVRTYSIDFHVPDGLDVIMDTLVREHVNGIESRSRFVVNTVSFDPNTVELPLPYINSTTNHTVRFVLAPKTSPFGSAESSLSTIPFVAVPVVVRFNWCGSTPITMMNCSTPKINLNSQTVRDILLGNIQTWNDSEIALVNVNNTNVEFPNETIRLILPPKGPTRDSVLQSIFHTSIPDSDLAPSGREYGKIETSLAMLQKIQFSLFVFPSVSDESVADDEQTTVAFVDSVLPSLDSVKKQFLHQGNTEATVSGYPFVVEYQLALPRFYDSCAELKHHRDAGGFLGVISDPQESLTAHVVDLARFLLAFPKRASTVEIAELPPRIALERNLTNGGDDLVARVLSSFHGMARYPYPSKQVRAQFFQSLRCAEDNSAVILESEALNIIPLPVTYVLSYAFVVISFLLFIALGLWVHFNSHRKVIKFASPAFLHQVLVGAAICVLSLVPLAQQEFYFDRAVGHDPAEIALLDHACASVPWLYSIGYTTIFLALFVKTWRLVRIFDNPRMKKFRKMKDEHLFKAIFVGLCIIGILNGIWLYTDALHWERVPTQLSPDRLTVLSSVGLCTVKGDPWLAVAPLLATTLTIMVGGLILCYKARNLPTDFQESSWISLSLVLQFQSLLFALLVLTFTGSTVQVAYITKVVVVMLNSTGTVLLIFLPKLWAIHGWGAAPTSSSGGSKEQRAGAQQGEESLIASMQRKDSSRNQPLGDSSKQSSSLIVNGRPLSTRVSSMAHLTSRIGRTQSKVPEQLSSHQQGNSLRPTESELRNLTLPSVGDLTVIGPFDDDSIPVTTATTSKRIAPQHHTEDNLRSAGSTASVPIADSGDSISSKERLFMSVLSDPVKRNRFRKRLVQRRMEEGLDFFMAVIERDRLMDPEAREAATLNVVRRFILSTAPKQINLPSRLGNHIISACLNADKSAMLSDAFFHPAAALHAAELKLSGEFLQFVREDDSTSGSTSRTSNSSSSSSERTGGGQH